MKVIFSVSILFIMVSNLFGNEYRLNSPGWQSGYIRSGDIKLYKYQIPQGYKAKVYFKSSRNSDGADEVKMRYQDNGIVPGAYPMSTFRSSRTSYVGGSCDFETGFYVRLDRNINDTFCHYDLNVQLIPMANCQTTSSSNVNDMTLYLNKSKSKSAARNDVIRYMLEPSVEGKVDIKLDNMSADLDLYIGKVKNGIGVAILHKKWDCRPYWGGTRSEECSINLEKSDALEVVVHGYRAGNYRVTATKEDVRKISVGESKSGYVGKQKWDYYKVSNPNGLKKLTASLHDLRADIDLYVRRGKLPTYYAFDCRSWNSGSSNEECKIDTSSSNDKIYIGVRGYRAGGYILSLEQEQRKKATILLHGLASSSDTWNELVRQKFNNKCTKVFNGNLSGAVTSFTSGEDYCFKVDFGAHDQRSGLKDILGNICPENSGCRGDYSTFETLGKEVESAVKSVLNKLGSDTDITLVGHSRGGLAASAYLGRRGYGVGNVKSVLTTGTPFKGSPLGKINSYMKTFCLPYATKVNDTRYCKQDWEARQFIKDAEKVGEGLDIVVPSVSQLREGSAALKEIFSANRIRSMQRGTRDYKSLVYKGVQLGNLGRKVGLVYNPFPSINGGLDYIPSVKEFSERAEQYMIGYNPQSMAVSQHGDGIVPYKNQDIVSINAKDIERTNGLHPMVANVTVSFNPQNRTSIGYNKNVLHVQEPKQVNDLSAILDGMWMRQVRNQIHTLLPATITNRRVTEIFSGPIGSIYRDSFLRR